MKERKRQRIRGKGSGKISAIPPRSVGFSIRFARVGIRDICDFTSNAFERKSRDARMAYALHSCDCCIGKEIMRGISGKKMSVRGRISGKLKYPVSNHNTSEALSFIE